MFALDLAPSHTQTHMHSKFPAIRDRSRAQKLSEHAVDGFICTLNVKPDSCKSRVTDRIIARAVCE